MGSGQVQRGGVRKQQIKASKVQAGAGVGEVDGAKACGGEKWGEVTSHGACVCVWGVRCEAKCSGGGVTWGQVGRVILGV